MRRLRLAAHAGIALTVGLGAGVAIASAEWYLGNADSGTYVSVPNGWYTGNGTTSNWIKGLFADERGRGG